MITESPIAYFGNREQSQDDIVAILTHHRSGKKYRCFYDLFCGSASIMLAAIQHNIAERYIMNDLFGALYYFWIEVRDNPENLITQYESLLTQFNATTNKVDFYKHIRDSINLHEKGHSAAFAFTINNATLGMPALSSHHGKPTLVSTLNNTDHPLAINTRFRENVHNASLLLKNNNVKIACRDFQFFEDLITSEDAVVLDPPFPDLKDASESPHQYIYPRNASKEMLRNHLVRFLDKLDTKNATYLLFYGALGLENDFPISRYRHHALRLGSHSFDYLENAYLSASLTPFLSSASNLGTFQPLFHKMIECHAQSHSFASGTKRALVWNDINNEEKSATYLEINASANRLARLLLATIPSGDEPLVAICLERSPSLYISMIAILKSGYAFLPLDASPSILDRRVCYDRIIQSGAHAFITSPSIRRELEAMGVELTIPIIEINPDDYLASNITAGYDDSNLNKPITHDQLAYVMYTSGSTGQPKGVEILHRGLPFAFTAHHDLLNLSSTDRISQFASISFDASIMEIMLALGSGAELHIVNETGYHDSRALTHFLNKQKITVALQTPKKLATLNPNQFNHLRAILIIGDKFTKDLSDQWIVKSTLPSGQVALRTVINGYGLTETTICTSLSVCNRNEALTAGEPILGLDVEITTEGELYVSGASLARGYWKQPNLTQERFIKTIIQGHEVVAYKTGDLAHKIGRHLLITGRADRQVKIRGQRIEPAEIEKILLQHDAIADARVISCGNLALYMVPKDTSYVVKNKTPHHACLQLLSDIRRFMKSKMPLAATISLSNMTFLNALPKKQNDKLSYDDAALQSYALPCIYLTTEPTVYSSEDEQTLSRWLKQQLSAAINLSESSMPDHPYTYTELGGDSLSVAIAINTMLNANDKPADWREEIDSLIPSDILHSSISQMIACLKNKKAENVLKHKAKNDLLASFTNVMDELLYRICGVSGNEMVKKSSHLPIFAMHSILGDAELDYKNSIIGKSTLYINYINFNTDLDIDTSLRKTAQLISNRYASCWLIGWSSGGYLAKKLANIIRLSGCCVYLFIIDTTHPALIQQQSAETFIDGLMYVGEKIKQAGRLLLNDAYFEFAIPTPRDIIASHDKSAITDSFFNRLDQAIINSDYRKKLHRTIHAAREIIHYELRENNPLLLDETDILFVATKNRKPTDDILKGWRYKNELRALKIDDDHFGILNHPKLIKYLCELIAEGITYQTEPMLKTMSEILSENSTPQDLSYFDVDVAKSTVLKNMQRDPHDVRNLMSMAALHLPAMDLASATDLYSRVYAINPTHGPLYSSLVPWKSRLGNIKHTLLYAACAAWYRDTSLTPYLMILNWSIRTARLVATEHMMALFYEHHCPSGTISQSIFNAVKSLYKSRETHLDWLEDALFPMASPVAISLFQAYQFPLHTRLAKHFFAQIKQRYPDAIKLGDASCHINPKWIMQLTDEEALKIHRVLNNDSNINFQYMHAVLVKASKFAQALNHGAGCKLPAASMQPIKLPEIPTATAPTNCYATLFFGPEHRRLVETYQLTDFSEPSLGKALRKAAASNRATDLLYFLAHVNANHADANPKTRKTALHHATERGHLDICEHLILAGAKLDIPDAQGNTALVSLRNHVINDFKKLSLKN